VLKWSFHPQFLGTSHETASASIEALGGRILKGTLDNLENQVDPHGRYCTASNPHRTHPTFT